MTLLLAYTPSTQDGDEPHQPLRDKGAIMAYHTWGYLMVRCARLGDVWRDHDFNALYVKTHNAWVAAGH